MYKEHKSPNNQYFAQRHHSAQDRLIVPSLYLHGRQTPSEYRSASTKHVDEELSKHGFHFLLTNPINLCIMPCENGLIPVILDGHHRVRRAPKFGITNIPAFIYSLEETAQFLHMKTSDVSEEFSHQIIVAISEFSRKYTHYEAPKIISFAKNMEELRMLARMAPVTTAQGLLSLRPF